MKRWKKGKKQGSHRRNLRSELLEERLCLTLVNPLDDFGVGSRRVSGDKPVVAIMIEYSDTSFEDDTTAVTDFRDADYYHQLLFGPQYPNVADYFSENSRSAPSGEFTVVPANQGVVGSYRVPDDPDTTNVDESIFAATREVAGAGTILFANLRAPNERFVKTFLPDELRGQRGTLRAFSEQYEGRTLAQPLPFADYETFKVIDLNGGVLRYGDEVRFKTLHDHYFIVDTDSGFVFSDATTIEDASTFVIEAASDPASTDEMQYVPDEDFAIRLRTSNGQYVRELATSMTTYPWPTEGTEFGLVPTVISDNAFIRSSIQVAADEFDFAAFRGDDGTISHNDLGIMIIESRNNGGGAGGATRSIGPLSVETEHGTMSFEGSAVFVNERSDFHTFSHELSHLLAGTTDLYGPGHSCLSKNLTLMSCSPATRDTLATESIEAELIHLDPWHKMLLGWESPSFYDVSDETEPLTYVLKEGPVVVFDSSVGYDEYYIFEQRPYSGYYDVHATSYNEIPVPGVAVWYVKTDGNHRNPSVAKFRSLRVEGAEDAAVFAVDHQGTHVANPHSFLSRGAKSQAHNQLWKEGEYALRWSSDQNDPQGFVENREFGLRVQIDRFPLGLDDFTLTLEPGVVEPRSGRIVSPSAGSLLNYSPFGATLATTDFDRDGHADLIVGDPEARETFSNVFGAALVYRFDPETGQQVEHQRLTAERPESSSKFGQSIVVGDFDGDDFSDLAIGSPWASPVEDVRSGAVSIFRFDSGTGQFVPHQVLTRADFGGAEGQADDEFGASLAAGDFDGNGTTDLAIGAPGVNDGEGRVYIVQDGELSALSNYHTVSGRFGEAMAANDITLNGRDELVIGAPEAVTGGLSAGQVQVFGQEIGYFRLRQTLDENDFNNSYLGSHVPAENELFGAALAIADFTADGNPDLAVGAPGENGNQGLVFVYDGLGNGGSTSTVEPLQVLDQGQLERNEADDRFGAALAAGDFSGDDVADLVVGAPGEIPFVPIGTNSLNSGRSGVVYTFRATPSKYGIKLRPERMLSQIAAVYANDNKQGPRGPEYEDDLFGAAVVVADVNADGLGDVVVGAPGDSDNSTVLSSGVGVVYQFDALANVGIIDALQGTPNDDTWYVRVDETGSYVEVYRNATGFGDPDFSTPLDAARDRGLQVYGRSGNDHLVVDYSGGIPFDAISFLGGFDGDGDTLEIIGFAGDDNRFEISDTAIRYNPSTSGQFMKIVAYQGVEEVIVSGPADSNHYIVQQTAAGVNYHLEGGSGYDTFWIGTEEERELGDFDSRIHGNIFIDGGRPFRDNQILIDDGDDEGDDKYQFIRTPSLDGEDDDSTFQKISEFGFPSARVSYSRIQRFSIDGNEHRNTFDILHVPEAMQLSASGFGNDDTFYVGENTFSETIRGNLSLHGGPDDSDGDRLFVRYGGERPISVTESYEFDVFENDFGIRFGSLAKHSTDTFQSESWTRDLTYKDFATIELQGSDLSNTFSVNDALFGTELTIYGNGGNDHFRIESASVTAPMTVHGGANLNGEGDGLMVRGTGSEFGWYRPEALDSHNGTFETNGQTITFTGLEPVTVENFDLVTMVSPLSHDDVTIDPIEDGLSISGTSTNQGLPKISWEVLEIRNVRSVVVDLATNDNTSYSGSAPNPDDNVIISSGALAAPGIETVAVSTGWGINHVHDYTLTSSDVGNAKLAVLGGLFGGPLGQTTHSVYGSADRLEVDTYASPRILTAALSTSGEVIAEFEDWNLSGGVVFVDPQRNVRVVADTEHLNLMQGGNGRQRFAGAGENVLEVQPAVNSVLDLELVREATLEWKSIVFPEFRFTPPAGSDLDPIPLVVSHSLDDGPGSLRHAITRANAIPGTWPLGIEFALSEDDPSFHDVDAGILGGDAEADVFVIQPLSPLPPLRRDNIRIDGSSQASLTGDSNPLGPEIVIDGTFATGSGLVLASEANEVRGLAIHSFVENGILITADENEVHDSYIGLDATGTQRRANGGVGVFVADASDNRIADNVISGNAVDGVVIVGEESIENVVLENRIGTDASGTVAIGNTLGVHLDDASKNVIEKNLISGNVVGIHISGETAVENLVRENIIGADVHGEFALPNGADGIFIDGAPENTIEQNLISGNGANGVVILGADASENELVGNYIGTDASARYPLGNAESGIKIIDAPKNVIGGTTTNDRNVISANLDGVTIIGGEATENELLGNHIGTTLSGLAPLGNAEVGVKIVDAEANIVGGTVTRAGNVIAGNGRQGISILRGQDHVIEGNLIGVGKDGQTELANYDGVYLTDTTNVQIGGASTNAGNVISANQRYGIVIDATHQITIQGNRVGTDNSGSIAAGHQLAGIELIGNAEDTAIGGTTTGAANVISGNVVGIRLTAGAAADTAIEGNLIGTNADGDDIVGNETGIQVRGNDALLSPGDLDPTFGVEGTVATDFDQDHAHVASMTVQPDGKTIVVGSTRRDETKSDFALARYNADGSLDPAFGVGGKVVTDLRSTSSGYSSDGALDVAIDASGKIVVVGHSSYHQTGEPDFALVRYNPDGSLDDGSTNDSDPSDRFGLNGKVIGDFGTYPDWAEAVAVDADGKIVVAGTRTLARYNADGSLDTEFGNEGRIATEFGYALAIYPEIGGPHDGKIILGGRSENDFDFALSRYNSDGSLDTEFASDGMVTTDFGGEEGAYDLSIDAQSRIVMAGSRWPYDYPDSGQSRNAVLARYDGEGSLDAGFGTEGLVSIDIADFDLFYFAGMALDHNGQIVFAAQGRGGTNALVRLNGSDGSLDPEFGNAGTIVREANDFAPRDLTLGPAGNILVAGNWATTFPTDFGLTRYYAGDAVATQDGDTSIGGTDAGAANVIAGNTEAGIHVVGGSADNVRIEGNRIGTDIGGTLSLPNDSGVLIENASGVRVGGTETGAGNQIRHNLTGGVVVVGESSASNTIRGNAIDSNGGPGIDLGSDGVTPNDILDSDTGPNSLLNYPELRPVRAGDTTTVAGTLISSPNATFTLDFYASQLPDESGYGEGRRWLSSIEVVTGADGIADFGKTLSAATYGGEFITATATDSAGNTSEFSAGVVATGRDDDGVLVIGGTNGPDVVEISSGSIHIVLNGETFIFDDDGTSEIDLRLFDGDDTARLILPDDSKDLPDWKLETYGVEDVSIDASDRTGTEFVLTLDENETRTRIHDTGSAGDFQVTMDPETRQVTAAGGVRGHIIQKMHSPTRPELFFVDVPDVTLDGSGLSGTEYGLEVQADGTTLLTVTDPLLADVELVVRTLNSQRIMIEAGSSGTDAFSLTSRVWPMLIPTPNIDLVGIESVDLDAVGAESAQFEVDVLDDGASTISTSSSLSEVDVLVHASSDVVSVDFIGGTSGADSLLLSTPSEFVTTPLVAEASSIEVVTVDVDHGSLLHDIDPDAGEFRSGSWSLLHDNSVSDVTAIGSDITQSITGTFERPLTTTIVLTGSKAEVVQENVSYASRRSLQVIGNATSSNVVHLVEKNTVYHGAKEFSFVGGNEADLVLVSQSDVVTRQTATTQIDTRAGADQVALVQSRSGSSLGAADVVSVQGGSGEKTIGVLRGESSPRELLDALLVEQPSLQQLDTSISNVEIRRILGEATTSAGTDIATLVHLEVEQSSTLVTHSGSQEISNDALIVGGGTANDTIELAPTEVDGQPAVTAVVNGTTLGAYPVQGPIYVDGFEGDDSILLDADITNNAVVSAGSGDDVVETGSGNDSIDAGDGDDVVSAGAGDDVIDGGPGNDQVDGQSGSDTVQLGDGSDTVVTDENDDLGDFAMRLLAPHSVTEGSAAVRGQEVTLASTYPDPASTVEWMFGDGNAASGQEVSHVYPASGSFRADATISDSAGNTTTLSRILPITAAAMQVDPVDPEKTALVVGGTLQDDHIVVNKHGNNGEIKVLLDGGSLGIFSPNGHILVYGQDGDDNIQVAGSVTKPAWLFGEDGNDRLNGGNATNVLIGGPGDDRLQGGSDRDLLIGGLGADQLGGNGGDDILVGGWLDFADRNVALAGIMAEWTSQRSFDERMANLSGDTSSGSFSQRANGDVFLHTVGPAATVRDDDDDDDRMSGASARDWFFANLDQDLLPDLHRRDALSEF